MHNLKRINTYGPLFWLLAMLWLTGCSAFKPQSPAAGRSSSPFLENIVVSTDGKGAKSGPSDESMPALEDNYRAPMEFNTGISVTDAAMVQFRYAILLNTEVEKLGNQELYGCIDSWWGTPYKIGGMTRRGIDCSAFVQNLSAVVFGLTLPRTAGEQKQACTPVERSDLQEGDLVFFNTRGGVSHVGVYLHNDKFVHASTSGGVTISDLKEPYWEKRYLGGGRPRSK